MDQKNKKIKLFQQHSGFTHSTSLRGFTIHRLRSAFTIVELLVVIVVIGILALITSVAYSGIADRARAASLQADLKNAATILEMDKINSPDNTYPPTLEDANGGNGLPVSSGNVLEYTYSAGDNTYTLTATNGDLAYEVTSDNTTPVLVGGGGGGGTGVSFAHSFGGNNEAPGYILQTSDEGYVVSDEYYDSNSTPFIAKMDSNGDLVWNRRWGGVSSDDYYGSAMRAVGGGYYLTGETSSYDVARNDAFIAKFNDDGSLDWNKTWGSTYGEELHHSIPSSDGGIVLVGSRNSAYSTSTIEAYIVKFSSSGTFEWSKGWNISNKPDEFYYVIETPDGDFIATGYGGNSTDLIIAKFSGTNGNLIWNKTWGSAYYDYGWKIAKTSDGNFMIFGNVQGFDSDFYRDTAIIKIDTNGNIAWDRVYGLDDNDELVESVVAVDDGGAVFAGTSYDGNDYTGRAYIAKISSDGSLDWHNTWQVNDSVHTDKVEVVSLATVTDGGYAVAGSYQDLGIESCLSSSAFLVKFNVSGNLTWGKAWGGDENSCDDAWSMIHTSDGGYAMTTINESYYIDGHWAALLKFTDTGYISSCSPVMCSEPDLIINSPSGWIDDPAANISTPAGASYSVSATVTMPSGAVSTPSFQLFDLIIN